MSDPEWKLDPFDLGHAERVRAWAEASGEFSPWPSPPSRDTFRSALADPDIHPYLLHVRGHPCAYGEIWIETDPDEIELARIVVDPALRNRGIGRRLVALLLEHSAQLPGPVAPGPLAWLRVQPENAAALACYAAAGFTRASPADETRFNQGQPHAYHWLRRALPPREPGA